MSLSFQDSRSFWRFPFLVKALWYEYHGGGVGEFDLRISRLERRAWVFPFYTSYSSGASR